jgi:uncharacterized membrane protein YraQ (UPF0718 family)
MSLPIIAGVLMLVSLAVTLIPKSLYSKVFTGSYLIDPFLGAIFGSISAGNPLTSYVIGGELLQKEVGLMAVTAFILSWVTVGFIQFPAEALMLGKKFAVVRNMASFVSALVISILVVITLNFL